MPLQEGTTVPPGLQEPFTHTDIFQVALNKAGEVMPAGLP